MSPHPPSENPPTYTESTRDTLVDEPAQTASQARILPLVGEISSVQLEFPQAETTSPSNPPSPTKPIKAKRGRRKGIKRVFKKVVSVGAKTGAAILAAPVVIIAVVINVVYEGGKLVLKVISIPLLIPICLVACCMEFDY